MIKKNRRKKFKTRKNQEAFRRNFFKKEIRRKKQRNNLKDN